jgi:hypothetical protein
MCGIAALDGMIVDVNSESIIYAIFIAVVNMVL